MDAENSANRSLNVAENGKMQLFRDVEIIDRKRVMYKNILEPENGRGEC
jgi:hypothetical protein